MRKHTRKRATHNSYDYYLIHTSAKWLKWKTGTIGLKLSKRRPRWEGCDSTDTKQNRCSCYEIVSFPSLSEVV